MTLLENLDDPIAKKSINLLPEAQEAAVNAFFVEKRLPEKIPNDLIQGMQQALSGLIAIPIKPTELLDALNMGGAPCTVEQMYARFEDYLDKLVRGNDQTKVRLVIDRGESSEGPK